MRIILEKGKPEKPHALIKIAKHLLTAAEMDTCLIFDIEDGKIIIKWENE